MTADASGPIRIRPVAVVVTLPGDTGKPRGVRRVLRSRTTESGEEQ